MLETRNQDSLVSNVVMEEHGDHSPLPLLQQELLEHILSLSDLQTIPSALAASKVLRAAAAQLITCLVAKQDLLSAHIWNAFPVATRIKIQRTGVADHHLQYLKHLLATLPSRVSFFEDLSDALNPVLYISPSASLAFAEALVASACSSSLLTIEIQSALLTTAAADIILQALPRLQQAQLMVFTDFKEVFQQAGADEVWRPKFGASTDLRALRLTRPDESWGIVIDLLAMTSVTKLQELSVSRASATNISALQGLASLQQLALDSTDCSAASWAALANLPSLDALKLHSLEIGADAAAAASAVRHLETQGRLGLQHTDEQLPGCLARQLPHLQHACLGGYVDTARLATALQGHQQLSKLETAGAFWFTAAWPLLASLPQLQTLLVYMLRVDASMAFTPALNTLQCRHLVFVPRGVLQITGCLARQLPQLRNLRVDSCLVRQLADALQGHQQLQHLWATASEPGPDRQHDVLVNLASCSRLEELSVSVEAEMVTAAGCAALAAGACREGLRVVELRGAAVEPAHVVVLLAAGMSALQQVVFSPPAAGQDRAAALQQVEQVLPEPGVWDMKVDPVPHRSAIWVCRLTRRAAAGAGAAMMPA